MSREYGARDRSMIGLVTITATVWALVCSLGVSAMNIVLEGESPGLRFGAAAGTAALAILVLYLGRNPILDFLLHASSVTAREDLERCGAYTIQISYPHPSDSNVPPTRRSGTVEIEPSITGLLLTGGPVVNEHGEKVLESWVSEFAQFVHTADAEHLVYAYKIRRPDNDMLFDKFGLVIAKHSDRDGDFVGDFTDLQITGPNEQYRKGQVVLIRKRSSRFAR